jgi:hypothetical protein
LEVAELAERIADRAELILRKVERLICVSWEIKSGTSLRLSPEKGYLGFLDQSQC